MFQVSFFSVINRCGHDLLDGPLPATLLCPACHVHGNLVIVVPCQFQTSKETGEQL